MEPLTEDGRQPPFWGFPPSLVFWVPFSVALLQVLLSSGCVLGEWLRRLAAGCSLPGGWASLPPIARRECSGPLLQLHLILRGCQPAVPTAFRSPASSVGRLFHGPFFSSFALFPLSFLLEHIFGQVSKEGCMGEKFMSCCVFFCSHNRSTQTQHVRTASIYYLTVLEVTGLKSRCW